MNQPTNEPLSYKDEHGKEHPRVDAHTKPHYWIFNKGAKVWNRWVRGDYTEYEWAERRKEIGQDLNALTAWDAFWNLNLDPLNDKERKSILADIHANTGLSRINIT